MAWGVRRLHLTLPATAVARGDIAMAVDPNAKTAVGDRRIAAFDEDALTLAWEAAAGLADCRGTKYWADFCGGTAPSRAAAILALADGDTGATIPLAGGARGGWDLLAAGDVRERGPIRLLTTSVTVARLTDPAAATWCDAAAGVAWDEDAGLELLAARQREIFWADVRIDAATGFVESDMSAYVAKRYADAVREIAVELGAGSEVVLAVSVPASSAAKRLARLKFARVVTTDFKERGYAGTADPAFVLADALKVAKQGQDIVLCVLGDGITAFHFRLADASRVHVTGPRWPTSLHRCGIEQWRRFRRLDGAAQPGPGGSQVLTEQDSPWEFGLRGARCGDCGALSYPAQSRCHVCGGTHVEFARIASRGEVFTLTIDHLHDSLATPTVMLIADMRGGGRVYLQGTDDLAHAANIGTPVELAFRRIHDGEDGRTPHYFWKLRSAAE